MQKLGWWRERIPRQESRSVQ